MKNPAINGISQYQESQEITAGMTMNMVDIFNIYIYIYIYKCWFIYLNDTNMVNMIL